jgi:enediyne biosynthesis protein E4
LKPSPTLALIVLTAGLAGTGHTQATPPRHRHPEPDIGVTTLPERRAAQIAAAAAGYGVFHGFQFSDRLAESGITFVHRAVDDVTRHYRPVHYDHGSGLAAADVDGDGVTDLYFVNQAGGNELWKGVGGGRFANITEQAGVALKGRINVTASFGDIDNDGDQDLFVTTVRDGNVLFENDGRGRFKDISGAAGVGQAAHSSGSVLFDYDRDGRLDLFVCNVGSYTHDEKGPDGHFVGRADAFSGHLHPDRFESPVLYRNLGGHRFSDVSTAMGLLPKGWCGDASAADPDGDGWPDLYVLNMQGDNHYYENAGGTSFVEKTARYFPRTPWGAMGIKFFDYDNDGRLDLLLTDMHSDMSQEVGPDREKVKSDIQWPDTYLQGGADNLFGNAAYHNLGGGRFEEVSDRLSLENYWPWGVSVGDVNADGWDDVFITAGMGFPFRYGINSMLLNDRGQKFLDAEFVLGIEPRAEGRTHTPWADLDCDTEAKGGPACQGRTGMVTVVSPRSSRSSVMLDLEGDGDLDIVTSDLHSEPMVLTSTLAQRTSPRWLKVDLTGRTSNRNGLGATVRVHAGGRVYMKQHDGKSGYLSQSVLPLYFGLGDATRVDRVEVSWPSGQRQTVARGLRVNDTLRIVEPK